MTPSIGIDPGKHGGLAVLRQGTSTLTVTSIPYVKATTFTYGYWTALFSCEAPVIVEEVGGLPGDRAQVAFVLGHTNGFWAGVLSGAGIAPTFVAPQIWQTRFARQFGVRWCPPDYDDRKKFIQEKINTLIPAHVSLDMADAVALAWLRSKELI